MAAFSVLIALLLALASVVAAPVKPLAPSPHSSPSPSPSPAPPPPAPSTSLPEFNIRNYGAVPDKDISQSLLKAWNLAIASPKASNVLIPEGTWMLSQVYLSGPNKAAFINLEVRGNLTAYPDPAKIPDKTKGWITVEGVKFLTISGGGILDGKGQTAWRNNDCKTNPSCTKPAISLELNKVNDSTIRDITSVDSKFFHVKWTSSRNVTFQRFTASAPGDSPNTDGIHIARSSNIKILDSVIGTGDDCVSMGDGLTDVLIRNVACGPGHGISIGSLGKYEKKKETDVKGIRVEGCRFTNTQNGARIKTFATAVNITVSDIHFVDLTMKNVANPVIVTQGYCPNKQCPPPIKPSQIQISGVEINNVTGTSAKPEVVTFKCSSAKPCADFNVGYIDLKYAGKMPATTICENINKPKFSRTQNPRVCGGPSSIQTLATNVMSLFSVYFNF